MTAGGKTSFVRCVIEIPQANPKPIILLPKTGLWITQDHPIMIDG
jgi:hypothetical protein